MGGLTYAVEGDAQLRFLSARRPALALRKRSGTKRVTIAGNRHALRTDAFERSVDRERTALSWLLDNADTQTRGEPSSLHIKKVNRNDS